MAYINKVRILRDSNSNNLEDRVNTFLKESMENLPGFGCMNLCYQVNMLPDNRKSPSASDYKMYSYSVMIHYVVGETTKAEIEKLIKGEN